MRTAAALLIFGFAAAGAEPDLVRYIMPDARVISGIDVARSVTTPFGRYVLSQMDADDDALRAWVAETGLEPAHDLSTILIGTNGTSEHPRPLVIARGTFDPARIAAAAKAHGGTASDYHGVSILSRRGTYIDGAIAFPEPSTMLVGDLENVRDAIDRRSPPNEQIASSIAQLSSAYDAWFLSTGPLSDFLAGKMEDDGMGQAMQGNLLAAVEHASGGMKFEADGVRLSADFVTRTEKDASALGDVARFVAGLVQYDSGSGRKGSLADSLELKAENANLKMSMAIPEAVMEKLFMPKAGAKAKKARTK